MKQRWLQQIAATSCVAAACAIAVSVPHTSGPVAAPLVRPEVGSAAPASERPRYGGTLNVELGELDEPAATTGIVAWRGIVDQIWSLTDDTLVRLDERGEPQPLLAESWEHDATMKRWKFHLRPGVKFHDGTPLAPQNVVDALQMVGGRHSATSDGVQFDLSEPAPLLPSLLAMRQNHLFRAVKNDVLATVGTGPFRVDSWDLQKKGHATASANADYWGGRPFVDTLNLDFSRTARDRMIDLQVGKADIIQIPPEMARRATDEKIRVEPTPTIELLALGFWNRSPVAANPRLREALSRAIDREAIVNLVLQKEGEAARALLPQWISGTEFLHPDPSDPAAASALVKEIGPAATMILSYYSDDELQKATAERIAVNAREAGITINLRGIPPAEVETKAENDRRGFDAFLVRVDLTSPVALHALVGALIDLDGFLDKRDTVLDGNDATAIYEREKSVLESYRVIPIAHLPRVYGLGARVRNWAIPAGAAMNGLPLADVWLEREAQ